MVLFLSAQDTVESSKFYKVAAPPFVWGNMGLQDVLLSVGIYSALTTHQTLSESVGIEPGTKQSFCPQGAYVLVGKEPLNTKHSKIG